MGFKILFSTALIGLLCLKGIDCTCSSIYDNIQEEKVATMCKNTVVQGIMVYIDTDLGGDTTLDRGTACTCHVKTQRGKKLSVGSYFSGSTNSKCGTAIDFSSPALGKNTIIGTPCYSYQFDVATHTYNNMSVGFRREEFPYKSTYCIRLSLGFCNNDQHQCGDGSCIPSAWACDSVPDCTDESDEKSCASNICPEGQVPCDDNTMCINIANRCDGTPQCKDQSDELPIYCSPGTPGSDTGSTADDLLPALITVTCEESPFLPKPTTTTTTTTAETISTTSTTTITTSTTKIATSSPSSTTKMPSSTTSSITTMPTSTTSSTKPTTSTTILPTTITSTTSTTSTTNTPTTSSTKAPSTTTTTTFTSPESTSTTTTSTTTSTSPPSTKASSTVAPSTTTTTTTTMTSPTTTVPTSTTKITTMESVPTTAKASTSTSVSSSSTTTTTTIPETSTSSATKPTTTTKMPQTTTTTATTTTQTFTTTPQPTTKQTTTSRPRCNVSSQFECGNGSCIPSKWRCDSLEDCNDKSDEIGCSSFVCGENMFLCDERRTCIKASERCDEKYQCPDLSDESPKYCGPKKPTSAPLKEDDGLDIAIIIGIICGVLFLLMTLTCIIYWVRTKNWNRRADGYAMKQESMKSVSHESAYSSPTPLVVHSVPTSKEPPTHVWYPSDIGKSHLSDLYVVEQIDGHSEDKHYILPQ